MQNDIYGRSVTLNTSDGQDIYTITNLDGSIFTLSFISGTNQSIVYAAINAIAPVIPNDIYGDTISLTTDGTNDYYLVNNLTQFIFPVGTSQTTAYLAISIAMNISNFETALNNFINSRYSMNIRLNLMGIFINAQINSLTNRQNYIAQLFPWQNSVIQYSSQYISSVSAATNITELSTINWDFTSLITSDPLITPIAALQISN